MASLVLVQAGLFPLVVTRNDRTLYISALESADNGDLKALVSLLAKLQRPQFMNATAIAKNVMEDRLNLSALLEGLRSTSATSPFQLSPHPMPALVDGHRIRVVSIDLDLTWRNIHQKLLAVIAPGKLQLPPPTP